MSSPSFARSPDTGAHVPSSARVCVFAQVLKSLESCLQHYNVCLQLYNPTRYPRRWGIAALEMGMAFGAMADLVEKARKGREKLIIKTIHKYQE